MLEHIASAKDLVTSADDTRRGFLDQALWKAKQAAPYLDEARAFWNVLCNVSSIPDLIDDYDTHADDLQCAAAFSQKAAAHVGRIPNALPSTVKAVLEEIEANKTDGWREDILYRFLLTKGDSLGGRMRNLIGKFAQLKLAAKIQTVLESAGHHPELQRNPSGKTTAIRWPNRLILFDMKPNFMDKSIDVILLEAHGMQPVTPKRQKILIEQRNAYLACGELKGGNDPAGADEHWKTATAALSRVRDSFSEGVGPALFFVGGAIEVAMAEEIHAQLADGRLAHAANLNKDRQLIDITEWLVAL